MVEDIPQPQPERVLYRRHKYRCQCCRAVVQGRSDLDLPGSRIGPRTRLLAAFAGVGLGVSLGKTQLLLDEFFGLQVSRAGLLGQRQWVGARLRGVAVQLLEMLLGEGLLHADETSWPHAGKYRWCWILCSPRIAVFLIRKRRDRDTFLEMLAGTLPGTLITDFYAVYNGLGRKQQRCLAHLATTLRELAEKLPPAVVARSLRPILDWVGAAFAFARERAAKSRSWRSQHAAALRAELASLQTRHSADAEAERMFNRLRRHGGELLTFRDSEDLPPDNNLAERAARGVANDRGMGRGSRSETGAETYGDLKTVYATCRRQKLNFFAYGMNALAARQQMRPTPLPLAQPP